MVVVGRGGSVKSHRSSRASLVATSKPLYVDQMHGVSCQLPRHLFVDCCAMVDFRLTCFVLLQLFTWQKGDDVFANIV